MNSYDKLMIGGDVDENCNNVEIEEEIISEFIVKYETNGEVKEAYFTVFESDDEESIFNKALSFAKQKNTITFFQHPFITYFNPKTGKEIIEPNYYEQFETNKEFVQIETDELPI